MINSSLMAIIIGIFKMIRLKFMWYDYYKKTYKNYHTVVFNQIINKFPINAKLNNNENILLSSIDEAALYAFLTTKKYVNFDTKTDSAIIHLKNNFDKENIKLYGITQNLDAILTFDPDDGTYDSLPLNGKIVLDIGACTGDTSIFFALSGASKVIALEPFPKNFKMLQKNILENNYSNKIMSVLGGCSSKSSHIVVDPNYDSSMRSILKQFDEGIEVPLISIENLVSEYHISDGILKMDCEGCEYESILNSTNTLLQKFSYIQIEYHHGYKNLKKKLEDAGFSVSTKIVDNVNRGHILAIRKS